MNSRVTWFLSALLGAIALSPQSVFANDSITPEMNGSTTVQFNDGMYRIENGNISGNNLFHSFEEFGLKPGETADFNITGLNIMNIVGRVVGGNVSVIDGLLQVSGGNANLFLMNPAGIIFGTGASINVPGDFTATTATAIGFGDDRWFNAYGPNDYTNLTGNPSEFAFDLANPQGIINLGNLSNMNLNGGDLTLLAGTIVSQGNLAAPNGNLIVASVPGSSLIRISQPGYLLSLEIERPRDANGLMQEIPITALPALLTGDLDNLFDRAENLEGIPIAARGLVASGDIWGEKGTADGNILVSAHGHLTLNDRWSTATQWEDAGNITLLARGNIEVEDLTASSSGEGNGGAIALFSQWGRISTQNIETTAERGFGGDVSIAAEGSIATENIITSSSLGESGGAIWLFSADGSINTEVLDSSADEGNGGDISLRSPGNIAIAYLNAEGLDFGGLAHISTDSYFRATGSFLSQNHLSASISTAGHLGGGSISIYHGGGEWTPFEVGSAEVNGTQGAITTGEYSLLPYEVFDSDFQDGDILISTNDPFLDDPSLGDPFHDMEFDPEEENTDLEFEENLSEEFDFFLENAELPQEELAREIEDNIEEHFTEEFATHLGVSEVANTTPEQAQQTLRDIERLTGIKPALVYAVFTADEPAENPLKSSRKDDGKLLWQSPQNTNANHQNFLPKHQTRRETDRLELVVVTAEGGVTRKPLPATREHVLKVANEYRRSVTNLRRPGAYLRPARELYQLLIAPLETHLQAQGINNLSFIMDAGLRGMPLAALHDGEQFAIEKYSLGMMPSLSLTDTNYRDLRDRQILAMGAETFSDQSDLPAVPVELSLITETLWSGKSYLNEEFTLDNFHAARQQGDYNILHLATHGEFKSGAPSNSYIQFWDRKLHLDRLQELKLNNPQIDLLVLSACRTALGDEQAELGFSGLAVMAGVKSALGSLWYVDDEGTLAFMSQFYDRLQTETTKAEALRQAQLAMLRGNLQVEGGKLMTPRGGVELPPELAKIGARNLAHPYYWGAFTLIGNPW